VQIRAEPIEQKQPVAFRSATGGQNYAYVWCGKDDPLRSEGGTACGGKLAGYFRTHRLIFSGDL